MRVTGIDPGKSGAAITLDSDSDYSYQYRLRYSPNGLLDVGSFLDFIQESQPCLILIEKIHGRGSGKDNPAGWSAAHNFNFGYYFGQLIAAIMISGVPFEMIYPRTWQKTIHAGLDHKKIGAKERSLIAYKNLFPHEPIPMTKTAKRPHDGSVDAMLIATLGIMTHGKPGRIRKWIFEKCRK